MKSITNTAFLIFPESRQSFCTGTYGSHLDALRLRESRNMKICSGSQVSFVKIFCVQGRPWLSLLIAHLQNCHQQKGDVAKYLRKHAMRSGLWSPKTRKVTFVWTRSLQYCCEMIGLADSRNAMHTMHILTAHTHAWLSTAPSASTSLAGQITWVTNI